MQKVEGSNPFSRLLLPAVEPKTKGWFVSLRNLALQLGSVVLPSKPEEQDQEQPIKQAQTAELAEWMGTVPPFVAYLFHGHSRRQKARRARRGPWPVPRLIRGATHGPFQ